MKKQLLVALLAATTAVFAQSASDTITLDLSDLTYPNPAIYDADDVWTGTNDTTEVSIESQVFSFSHTAALSYGYLYWNGFTLAKVASDTTNYMGCMAKGGMAGVGTPYLLGYYDEYNSGLLGSSTTQVIFYDAYKPVGVHVCNNTAAYTCVANGYSMASKFKQGDYLTLIVKGLDEDYAPLPGEGLTYYLADCRSANESEWTINKTWQPFDLSALGTVYGLSFEVYTTDRSYGYANTATYFCLDRLQVRQPSSTGIAQHEATATTLHAYPNPFCDRLTVDATADGILNIYDTTGRCVLSQVVAAGKNTLYTTHLQRGSYVARCGSTVLKLVK